MSVVDASVVVDALVVAGSHGDAARATLREEHVPRVPAVFRAEAASALRAMVAREELAESRARGALADLRSMRAEEYPFSPFAERAWELRADVTVYDAWYVALAERLGVALATADHRLTAAPGLGCPVLVVGASEDDRA